MYHMYTEMPAKTWNCCIYNTSLFSIIDVEVLRSFVTPYYCIGNHSDSVYVKLINFQIIPRGNTSVHWMNLLGGTHGIMVKGILSLKGLVSRDIVCKDNEPTTVAHIDNGFPVALTSLRCIEYTPGRANAYYVQMYHRQCFNGFYTSCARGRKYHWQISMFNALGNINVLTT